MGTIAGLLSAVIAAWAAWNFGGGIAWLLGWHEYAWVSWVLTFFAAYLTTNAILTTGLSVMQLAGGGIWSATPMRWVVGKCAFLLLLAVAVWIVGGFLPVADLTWGMVMQPLWPPAFAGAGSTMPPPWWDTYAIGPPPGFRPGHLAAQVAVFALVVKLIAWEKLGLAYGTKPLRQIWRAMKTGVGGSSSFNGLLDEWLMPWKPGKVILGASLYEPGQKLGKANNAHVLTIATSQSGKGRSCIIPNLLTWPGSALVVDPKGENAAVTALARRRMTQKVHIVDPFGLLVRLREGATARQARLDPAIYASQRFNPLAEINLADLDVVEQINNLGAALVMPSENANPFWDEASQQILAGILAHVLVWPKLKDSERHMVTVRDYVAGTNGRSIIKDMTNTTSPGNLAAVAAALLKKSSQSAGGDILTTLNVHMKWLDSVAMQQAMTVSDFSLAELKDRNTTLFLVIPPEYLKTHARFLRLFITLALRAAGRGKKPEHAMLFIMDEFAALGALKVVEDAAGQLAGMGVKLWPIIQNLTQLRPYGDNWEVFLANAGQCQVFAMNDQTTARYFSERLGQHIAWRKVRMPKARPEDRQEYEWVPQGANFLRTGVELARESSKDSGRALVFFEGGDVSLVRRAAYDWLFTNKEYSPNPYVTEPAFFSRAGIRAEGGIEEWWEALMEKIIYEPLDRRWKAWLGPRLEKYAAWGEKKEQEWADKRKQRTPVADSSTFAKASADRPPPAAVAPEPVRDDGYAAMSLDQLRAEYLRVDAALKAVDYFSMTPEEQKAFTAAYKPFFDAMLDRGVKNRAELKQMLGISDEPASAPGEITADQEADAAPPASRPEPQEPVEPDVSAEALAK
ncbi:MAG: type IV secretory system conjugative DNA transfer family protein, partial [Methylocella sp.]